MTVALLVLAILASQAFAVGRAHLGSYAPDPLILVGAFAALYWPTRSLLLVAVVLGWIRALTLLEPAGGQILCAWVTLTLVSSMRFSLREQPRTGFVLGAGLTAGGWALGGVLLGLLPGVQLQTGLELLLGAALALPVAGLAARMARQLGLAA